MGQVHPLQMEVQNQSSQQHKVQQQQLQKKQMNSPLFILCLVSILFLSYQNIFLFILRLNILNICVSVSVIVFTYTAFLITTCKMGRSRQQICHLYFLLDNILVALFASIAGFIGIMIVVMVVTIDYIIVIVVFQNINFILMAGTFRILLACCYWKTWHVISGKLTILISCGAYLLVAAFVIIRGLGDKNFPAQKQQSLKQFFFLYVFGLFTLYLQIYSKISDLDGTAEFKHHYSILKKDENKNKSVGIQNNVSNFTQVLDEINYNTKAHEKGVQLENSKNGIQLKIGNDIKNLKT